jgi:ribosomal protein L16 Arg81 hydroxylase
MPSELDALLQPVGAATFFESSYEREPLLLTDREVADVYRGFPDLEGFEELLWRHEDRLRRVLRVNKNGQYFEPPHPAQGKDVFRWAVDRFADGCTLILNGTDHLSVPVARVTRAIEVEIGGKVAANAFLTPAGSRGFLPHFDTHDVFVLQLHGAKVWRLYDRRVDLPVDRQIHLIDQATLGPHQHEFRLEPGDLLYVPRGTVHGPFTTDSASLHLTMGYRPLRWCDYLNALLNVAVEQDVALRQSLRPGSLEHIGHELPARLDILLRAAGSPSVRRLAMERFQEGFTAQLRPLPGGHMRSALRSPEVKPDTPVRRRPEALCHVYEVGNRVRIQFPGVGIVGDEDLQPGSIEAPLSAGGALRQIARSTAAFTARDLPPILALDSRLMLVRRLVREGLLVADPP